MLLGHYGVALAAKPMTRGTSLGWLVFASQFLDELWPVLLLLGVEQVRVVPGLMAASNFDFVSYPISHSLVTAIGWSLVVGGLFYGIHRRGSSALVVGALVLSHWFLDVPMHRRDLPLWPGSRVRVGLGLWNSVPITIAIELLLFVGGLLIYVRSTRARDRIGSWGLWAMVALLVSVFLSGLVSAGLPTPTAHTIALVTLGLLGFVPWCHWVDRHREHRGT